jgi:hypothetical protein
MLWTTASAVIAIIATLSPGGAAIHPVPTDFATVQECEANLPAIKQKFIKDNGLDENTFLLGGCAPAVQSDTPKGGDAWVKPDKGT